MMFSIYTCIVSPYLKKRLPLLKEKYSSIFGNRCIKTFMFPIFLYPGAEGTVASRQPSAELLSGSPSGGATSDKDKVEDTDVQDGRLTVYIHKRDDQSFHEVVQPLLR